jgi:hypothetical protein
MKETLTRSACVVSGIFFLLPDVACSVFAAEHPPHLLRYLFNPYWIASSSCVLIALSDLLLWSAAAAASTRWRTQEEGS